jgi:hypothetical protein
MRRICILLLLFTVGCSQETDPRVRKASAELAHHTRKMTNSYWLARTIGERLRIADDYFRDIPERVEYLDRLVQGQESATPAFDSTRRKAEVVWPR